MEAGELFPNLSQPAAYDVVGLGVSSVDVLSLVDHHPAEGEVLQSSEMVISGGGPVATALVTLARLGAHTAMVDALGDDWRGSLLLAEYEREGVYTGSLHIRKGHTSATASILVSRASGERTIVFYPGSAPELTPAELPLDVIRAGKILHLNGRHWQVCLEAAKAARQAGRLVSFDGGAFRFREPLRNLVPLTDICIIAADFAQKYTGESDSHLAARQLLKIGPSLVVITAGIRGSWIFPREGPSFHQPACLLPDTKDTTGCGDSYHGAFLFGLVRSLDLEGCAQIASATAALNSTQLGGRQGLPDLIQLKTFMADHHYPCPL